ncbi:hypothetical protein CsSME_00036631 [Camellia sinensis var. sinensis]
MREDEGDETAKKKAKKNTKKKKRKKTHRNSLRCRRRKEMAGSPSPLCFDVASWCCVAQLMRLGQNRLHSYIRFFFFFFFFNFS